MEPKLRSRSDRLIGWILGGIGAAVFLTAFAHIAVRLASEDPPGPGALAPSFVLTSPIDGSRLALEDQIGRVVLLDFWSSTCVGCIGATPKLNRLYERYFDRGFSVIGVNVGETSDEVRRFASERTIAYPLVIDESGVTEAYGVWSLPTVVLVDGEGRIVSRHRGPVTEELLAKEIEQSLRRASARPGAISAVD